MENNNETGGLPPFFKSWRQMYIALAIYLVLLIAALHMFSVWMR
ncbi:MAG: hypothetical protein RMJ87_05995 [Cytophagales bacterium]|nr:hypothetical protein [Bernardetiaceae bacterium]MDW8204561.1 hypothetical protein [Cytophagales bacterium]